MRIGKFIGYSWEFLKIRGYKWEKPKNKTQVNRISTLLVVHDTWHIRGYKWEKPKNKTQGFSSSCTLDLENKGLRLRSILTRCCWIGKPWSCYNQSLVVFSNSTPTQPEYSLKSVNFLFFLFCFCWGHGRNILRLSRRCHSAAQSEDYMKRNYANNVSEYNSVLDSLNARRRCIFNWFLIFFFK